MLSKQITIAQLRNLYAPSSASWLAVLGMSITVAAVATPHVALGQTADAIVEGVAENEIEPTKNSAGIERLSEATEKKLFAKRITDLDDVVEMCEEAIELGLPAESIDYAKELMAGTLYEKATQVLAPILQGGKMDRSWRQRRRMAMEALTKAAETAPNNADVQLLIAQLADLPGGDLEGGLEAAERAVELLAGNPARKSEALLTRAGFRETPEEQLKDVELAVEASGTNVEALRERAQLYLDLERDEDAIADLVRISELDQSDTNTRELVVELLAADGKFEQAIEAVNQLIEQDKSSAHGYVMRARVRLIEGKLDEALADCNLAIEVEPNEIGALLSRSQVLAEQEKYAEARVDVDRVLELEPGSVAALYLRSSLHQMEGDFESAVRDLNRLLRRDPDNVALRLEIATTYVIGKRPRRAIDIYTRIWRDDDSSWEALRGRADAYLGIGEHQKAIDDYKQALTLADDDDGILNNLAWVMSTSTESEVRNGTEAIKYAEQACELTDYEAPHILSTLAAAHAEAGDFDEAVKWSKKAVELGEGGEIDEQLAAELASYEAKKPWREKQEQEEPIEEEQQSADDLELGDTVKSDVPTPSVDEDGPSDSSVQAASGTGSLEELKVPSDP